MPSRPVISTWRPGAASAGPRARPPVSSRQQQSRHKPIILYVLDHLTSTVTATPIDSGARDRITAHYGRDGNSPNQASTCAESSELRPRSAIGLSGLNRFFAKRISRISSVDDVRQNGAFAHASSSAIGRSSNTIRFTAVARSSTSRSSVELSAKATRTLTLRKILSRPSRAPSRCAAAISTSYASRSRNSSRATICRSEDANRDVKSSSTERHCPWGVPSQLGVCSARRVARSRISKSVSSSRSITRTQSPLTRTHRDQFAGFPQTAGNFHCDC